MPAPAAPPASTAPATAPAPPRADALFPDDRRVARELVQARRILGSLTVAKGGLLVCALSLPFCVFVGVRFNPRLGLTLGLLLTLLGVYESGMLWLLQRGHHRPWLDWLNATVEVSTVSAVVLLDAQFIGAAYALTSAPMLCYGISILLSALRMSRTLPIYAGALAALEMFGVYLLLRARIEPRLALEVPSLLFANFVQRALYLLVSGLLASWVCASVIRVLADLVEMVRKEMKVRNTLGRHVSREVAKHLLSTSSESEFGRKRELTVMFCDLRDFTSFAETLDPSQVVQFLNHYFTLANRIIEAHGGLINKFIGDGIMALFGATTEQPAPIHAHLAAQAAVALERGMDELRVAWKLPGLRIGIGLHTGVAVVGIVGSADRMEFTAIGDTVNLASRIESLCKQHGCTILASGSTVACLSQNAQTRRIGETQVKGRRASTEVFAVESVVESIVPNLSPSLAPQRPGPVSLGTSLSGSRLSDEVTSVLRAWRARGR